MAMASIGMLGLSRLMLAPLVKVWENGKKLVAFGSAVSRYNAVGEHADVVLPKPLLRLSTHGGRISMGVIHGNSAAEYEQEFLQHTMKCAVDQA